MSRFNSQSDRAQYEKLGQSLLEQHHKQLATQLQVFQQALATFAKTYPDEIKSNHTFRDEFTKICLSVGVDPLAASLSSKRGSKKTGLKSLWGSVLNDNSEEFYNELGVKIIELCKENEKVTGGLMPLEELLGRLKDPQSPNSIADLEIRDIEQSVERLKVLDKNLKIVSLGAKRFLKSSNVTVSEDTNLVYRLCDLLGYASVELLVANYAWPNYRAKDVLESMVSSGLLWIDSQTGGPVQYWEPKMI